MWHEVVVRPSYETLQRYGRGMSGVCLLWSKSLRWALGSDGTLHIASTGYGSDDRGTGGECSSVIPSMWKHGKECGERASDPYNST